MSDPCVIHAIDLRGQHAVDNRRTHILIAIIMAQRLLSARSPYWRDNRAGTSMTISSCRNDAFRLTGLPRNLSNQPPCRKPSKQAAAA